MAGLQKAVVALALLVAQVVLAAGPGNLQAATSFSARLPSTSAAGFAAKKQAYLQAISKAAPGAVGTVVSTASEGAVLKVATRVQFPAGGFPSAAALVALLRQGTVFPAAQFGSVDVDFILYPYWATPAGAVAANSDLQSALMFTATYSGVAASWLTTVRTAQFKSAVQALLKGSEVQVTPYVYKVPGKAAVAVHFDTMVTAGSAAALKPLQTSLAAVKPGQAWPAAAFAGAAVMGAAVQSVCAAKAAAWCNSKPAAASPPLKASSPPPKASPPTPRSSPSPPPSPLPPSPPPPPPPPPPPVPVTPIPTIVYVDTVQVGMVVVSLTPGENSGNVSFLVEAKAVGCPSTASCPDVTAATRTSLARLSNLTTNQLYLLTAVAVSAAGVKSLPTSPYAVTPVSLLPAPTINGIITTSTLVIVSVHPTDAKGSPFRPIYTVTCVPDSGGLTVTVTSRSNAIVVRGLAKGTTYTITVVLQGSYESLPARTMLVPTLSVAIRNLVPTISEIADSVGGVTRITVRPPSGTVKPVRYEVTATLEVGRQDPTTQSINGTIAMFRLGPEDAFIYTAVGVLPDGSRTTASPPALSSTLAAAHDGVAVPTNAPIIESVLLLHDDMLGVKFAPPADSSEGIKSYTIFGVPVHGAIVTLTGAASPVALDALQAGSSYTIFGVANNVAGGSVSSAGYDFSFPPTAPTAPLIISISPGDSTLTLDWNPVEYDGGSPVTHYIVGCTDGNKLSVEVEAFYGPAAIGGLLNGRMFHCTVVAHNALGASTPALAVSATPSAAPRPPGAPEIVTVQPYQTTPGNARISWKMPVDDGGAEIVDYSLVCKSSTAAAPLVTARPTFGTWAATLTGLSVGSDYYCTIAAANSAGLGPHRTATRLVPLPKSQFPTRPAIALIQPIDTALTFMYRPPVDTGGTPLTDYKIVCVSGDETVTAEAMVGIPSLYGVSSLGGPTSIAGLTNGRNYSCTIVASNGAGTSLPSDAVYASPLAAPAAPSAPLIVGITPASGSLLVSWESPLNNGGLPVTNYTFTCQPEGGAATTLTVLTSPARMAGLINGVSYSCRVSASNPAAAGPASEPQAASPRGSETAPGAPWGVVATPALDYALLAWRAPIVDGGALVEQYTVTCTGLAPVVVLVTEVKLRGLEKGKSYVCQVVARNSVGDGPPASSDSFTPLPA